MKNTDSKSGSKLLEHVLTGIRHSSEMVVIQIMNTSYSSVSKCFDDNQIAIKYINTNAQFMGMNNQVISLILKLCKRNLLVVMLIYKIYNQDLSSFLRGGDPLPYVFYAL